MGLLVPTSLVLDLFGTGISDDSFCRFCLKGYCPGVVSAGIELGPPSLESPFEAGTIPIAGISYDRWFAIFVSLGSSPFPIPEGIPAEAVIKTVPDQDFVTERVTQEQDVINCHQARRGVRHEAVASFQPNSGVYRIVFAVPMRVPPELTVESYDVNLSAEVTHM
jgi:hypothetical protein